MDYFKNLSDQSVQREVFARQLKLAIKHNKPIVVHSRDAEVVLSLFVPPEYLILSL